MIDIHSKHDNMHKNEMFYALICTNKHIIICIDCMLSTLLTHFILFFRNVWWITNLVYLVAGIKRPRKNDDKDQEKKEHLNV